MENKQDAIIICFIYILENMVRSLNSKCDFDSGFFTCKLPEDAILLVLKVKTKTSNHTLVEDSKKWTNLDHGRNLLKMGRLVPENFQGYYLLGRMTIV